MLIDISSVRKSDGSSLRIDSTFELGELAPGFTDVYAVGEIRNTSGIVSMKLRINGVYSSVCDRCGNDAVLSQLKTLAPDICRCCGGGDAPLEMVERGLKYGCKKIQLVNWAFNKEMIDKAHENGMRCTIFWADETEQAKKYLDMGVDVILTNDYQRISQIIK